MSALIDSAFCPLCSKPNHCMVDGKEPCWCTEQTFDERLLKQIPQTLKNKSCICLSCVQKHAAIDKNVTDLS